MKNTIIFILGCFTALLFGELIGEKFSTARRARATYSTYYRNFYNGLRNGWRDGSTTNSMRD